MNLLKEREIYSWGAFILVLIGDALAVAGLRGDLYFWMPWIFGVILFPFVLLIIGRCNDVKFGLKSLVLSKLLANAIGPRLLSTLYLLAFVVHIGWLGNAFMSLFQSSSDLAEGLYALLACTFVIAVLIVFFPDKRKEKNADATKIIVTGISEIKVPYTKEYTDLNLRPLVRILENEDLSKCELLILKSNYNNINEADLSNNIKNVLYFIHGIEQVGGSNPVKSKTSKVINHIHELTKAGTPIDQQLKSLIREVVKREFPKKPGTETMNIDFTLPCDYDIFKSCFDVLSEKIKQKDDDKHRLVFYVSPGTSIVGSLMTLMAIDGDRKLFYYRQAKGLRDSERLKEVNKNSIPLKNLLSEAIEKIEDDAKS